MSLINISVGSPSAARNSRRIERTEESSGYFDDYHLWPGDTMSNPSADLLELEPGHFVH